MPAPKKRVAKKVVTRKAVTKKAVTKKSPVKAPPKKMEPETQPLERGNKGEVIPGFSVEDYSPQIPQGGWENVLAKRSPEFHLTLDYASFHYVWDVLALRAMAGFAATKRFENGTFPRGYIPMLENALTAFREASLGPSDPVANPPASRMGGRKITPKGTSQTTRRKTR